MKKTFTLILLLGLHHVTCGQIRLEGYNQQLIHPDLFEGKWTAYWISVPGEPVNSYGVYHFRKTVELDTRPETFIVHVSADNRYKLYVNGELVSLGPARGDIYNWNFETVDLAPYLRPGNNILAAEVWNFAELKPVAQVSFNQTGFILQGNTPAEHIANTDTGWMCTRNNAYSPWQEPVYGYYVAGPGGKSWMEKPIPGVGKSSLLMIPDGK